MLAQHTDTCFLVAGVSFAASMPTGLLCAGAVCTDATGELDHNTDCAPHRWSPRAEAFDGWAPLHCIQTLSVWAKSVRGDCVTKLIVRSRTYRTRV